MLTQLAYNEMLDELLRVKRLNARMLEALKHAYAVLPIGPAYQMVLEAIKDGGRG